MSNTKISKKIYIPIVVALLVSMVAGAWVITPALAASSGIQKMTARPLMSLGRIVEISGNRFTIERRDGVREVFLVDKDTRFFDRDRGTRAVFTDLDKDRFVIVGAARMVEGERTARVVFLLPGKGSSQGIITGHPKITTREAGEITAIDMTADTITFKPLAADLAETTFVVDKDTTFRSFNGSVKSLADLKVGMMGIIFAKEPAAESNEPVAVLVMIAKNQASNTSELRVAGRVTAVNGNSFTIEGRDGKSYTFQVVSSTVFRRRFGTAESLANLKVGMMVSVAAKDMGNNTFDAQVVVFVR